MSNNATYPSVRLYKLLPPSQPRLVLHRPRPSPLKPTPSTSQRSYSLTSTSTADLIYPTPSSSSMSTSSPLLFDLDEEFFASSPTFANPNDLLLKPEPDLTIPLGWGNDPSATMNMTPRSFTASDKPGPNHLITPHSDSSALHSASAPPLAPTSSIDDSNLFSSAFWQNEYLNSFGPQFADGRTTGNFADSHMNNPHSSIPWAQWTNPNSAVVEPPQGRDDLEMPPTPVDAFSINVDLYHPNNSSDQLAYSQNAQPNHLLSPFNSLGLSSPSIPPSSIPSQCSTTPQAGGLGISFSGPPSMYYDPHMMSQYDTPSPPASVVSVPPTTLDLTSAHVKIVPNHDHRAQTPRGRNAIPTLSSSLPASLAYASHHQSHYGSKPSPNSRASPPSQVQSSPTRPTRSRAMSEVSRPVHRRRGHSSQDAPEGSATDPLKPPKQSLSTWQFFFTEWIQKQDGRKLNVAQAAKEAGKEYKLLSDAEKEPYARRAAAARLNRQQALSQWHQTLTPSLIALENRYRTAQRKLGLSRRSNLKDPNAPKKPLSAYFMFLKAVREDGAWSDSVFGGERETTRQSVLAAARWREMSDDEKRPFLARAEHEKLQYEAARKEYEDSFNADDVSMKFEGQSTDLYNLTPQETSPRPRANSTGSRAMAFRLEDLSSEPSNNDGNPSMGYFSATPSANHNATIPIHIPKGRPRSGSTPSPTGPGIN